MSEFATDEVAEFARTVVASVAEEILSSNLAVFQCKENGLHHVEYIYEGDSLRLISGSEIHMLADALCHHEVILLARTIYSSWAQCDARQFALGCHLVEIFLALEFASPVVGVGVGSWASGCQCP